MIRHLWSTGSIHATQCILPHMNHPPPHLPWLWDYVLDEATFSPPLHGAAVVPPLNRDWAAVRLIEYAPSASRRTRRRWRSCCRAPIAMWRRNRA